MHDDNDSLFGSPPPSPERGRSPLLALPEDSGWRMENALVHTQNVGTIALPGSQNNFSKIPAQSAVQNVACASRLPFLKLSPPSIENKQRVELPSRPLKPATISTSTKLRASRPNPITRRHSERMDRTLSDLVSLISHFGPTESTKLPLPVSFNPGAAANQEGTKENPIQINDGHEVPTSINAVNSALIALASTVASALKLPNVPPDRLSLSEPAVHQVLQYIKHDPKLIPTLRATHEYLNSVHRNPSGGVSHPTDDSASKLKRKRKQHGPRIPAGAEHWNVPFPFAPGRAPAEYPTQWQLERGRGVLGELLGLFERAFVKSRVKDSLISEEPPLKRPRFSSTAPSFEGQFNVDKQILDNRRMTEWLSSISTPPSESVIDPVLTDVSLSNPVTSPSNVSLDDISNIIDVYPSNTTTISQTASMDFSALFNGFDWRALDITKPNAVSSTPIELDSFPLLDPSVSPSILLQNVSFIDLDSFEGIFQFVNPTNAPYSLELARSTQTVPTASGSSSVREGTPLDLLPPEVLPEGRHNSTKIQRKADLLLKAQQYQNLLSQRIEKIALKRWELQIEEGILQNLKKVTTGIP